MFVLELEPRFNDTDALGHINNASMVTWMEESRRPIFKIFNPTLSVSKWNLIIARVEMDYVAQCFFGKKVVIETGFEKIGNSSMIILHDMRQDGNVFARGKSVMVFFDYKKNCTRPIPQEIREALSTHFMEPSGSADTRHSA